MAVFGREAKARGATAHGAKPARPRFRLRFLLQEFELPEGETIIGRGSDCHITLHDPLVSRRHACIEVDSARAIFIDLRSRNGSRVNGLVADGPTTLYDRDRIRVGTQELVIAEVTDAEQSGPHRATGSLVYCAACALPYPGEIGACPNCGEVRVAKADTGHAPMSPGRMHVWAFELTMELLRRSLATGTPADTHRYLHQALDAVADRVRDGNPIDPAEFRTLFEAAGRVLQDGRVGGWVATVVQLCGQAGVRVPEFLAHHCEELTGTELTAVPPAGPASSPK